MDSGSNNYQGLASTSQQNTGATGQQPQPQSSGGGFAGQVGRALGGGSQPYNPFQPPPQVSRPLTGVPQYGGGTTFSPTPLVQRPPETFGPQYGGQDRVVTSVNRPLTDVPQYGGGTPYTLPPQVSRPPVDVPYTGQGAGPTSQPQTVEDMLARARGLIGSQGGGMGQPYISDRGYFGPGTMSNPTGPQYGGQDRVVTQVARPLTDVPQYGGGMGQPVNFYDADRATGDYRDRMAREMSGGMGDTMTTTQVSRPPEQLQQEIDRLRGSMGYPVGVGPGGNPFSPQQMQQIQQQISQLQQRYMPQAPQQLQQMQQRLQQTPQYQAMMRASQSGDPAAIQRAQRAFESTPQFQQLRAMGEAFSRQQMQAQQRMQADPRYQQLQSQINRLQPQVPQGGIGAALAGRMGA